MANGEAEQVLAGDGPGDPAEGPEQPGGSGPGGPDDAGVDDVVRAGGCRTERQGWAGAHLHGAVRPRRRAVGRGRPPGRWC